MHTSTQLIAQRALPATRTKARWQPYYSISSTASSSSNSTSRSPNMNTPNPTVSSPPPPHASSSNFPPSRPPFLATTAQTPKDLSPRDPSKHKFAAGLIDQAVNTLSEIWRPQDIPRVFQPPSKATSPLATSNSTLFSSSIQQSTSRTSPPSSTQPLNAACSEQLAQASLTPTTDLDQNLLPIKTFVHEVLRRSRTSGSILQAALCYLEAIRPKVPEILRQEQVGIRAHYLPDSTILPATPAELEREAELCAVEESAMSDDSVKTIRVTDFDLDTLSQVDTGDHISVSSLIAEPSAASSISTPSLPSPLLCPRRTFLASLILASKFFQDKCYSNRAWAKLSGLPPREIGRCERALGQALEWRLWVGKSTVAPQPAPAVPASVRTVVRSQSESSLFTVPSSSRPFLASEEVTAPKTSEPARDKQPHASGSRTRLRRCSTVPNNVFAAGLTGLCEASASTSYVREQDQDMDGTYEDSTHKQVYVSSFSEKCISPSCPPTPPLTYSPSSTECSLGDRTIQMSMFEDNVFPSTDGSQLWLGSVNLHSTTIKTTPPLSLEGKCPYVNEDLVLGLVGLASNANAVSIVNPDVDAYGSCYLWQEESHYRHVEPASVH